MRTVRAGDLAPDHTNVGAADLTLGPVNESDLLAEVEAGGLGVINALNLDQTGVGVGVTLSALVAQVATPVKKSVLDCCFLIDGDAFLIIRGLIPPMCCMCV
jgi:hypothetical protein